MKVFCISQARMGSTRLPSKVLKTIQDKPLLQYHIERLRQASHINQLIIATTGLPQDKAIVSFCQQHDISYFCGDENNVLSRFYHAAKSYQILSTDLIIRVTSDCPLIAPELIDSLIQQHIENNIQGISNIDIHSYPRGFDAEIFTMAALETAFLDAKTCYQFEHVTPYFYQHPERYPQLSIKSDINNIKNSPLRLCVDEIDDFNLIKHLVQNYPMNIIKASANDLIQFMHQHPEVSRINQNVQQKSH